MSQIRSWTLFESLRAPPNAWKGIPSHWQGTHGHFGSHLTHPKWTNDVCTVCQNSAEKMYFLFASLFLERFVISHLFSWYLVHWRLKNISNISKSTSLFCEWKLMIDLTHSLMHYQVDDVSQYLMISYQQIIIRIFTFHWMIYMWMLVEIQICTHPNHFTIKGAASIHRQAPSSFLTTTPYLLERAFSLHVEDDVDAQRGKWTRKDFDWSDCSLHVIFTIGWDEFYSLSQHL